MGGEGDARDGGEGTLEWGNGILLLFRSTEK